MEVQLVDLLKAPEKEKGVMRKVTGHSHLRALTTRLETKTRGTPELEEY